MSAKPVEIRVADAIAGDILTLPWSLCVSGQMATGYCTLHLQSISKCSNRATRLEGVTESGVRATFAMDRKSMVILVSRPSECAKSIAKGVATFKSPSKIEFVVEAKPPINRPRLSDTKRGDTFLWKAAHGRHDAAVCFRTDVSVYRASLPGAMQPISPESAKALRDHIFITNLQTGRTFIAEDCEIEYVKVKMTLEGSK